MKLNKLFCTAAVALLTAASLSAQTEEPKFMRSSIYSLLLNSDDQNTRLDKEASDADPNGYAETLQSAGIQSLGGVPKAAFQKLTIPEQFNNHNLDILIIDFDEIVKGISPEEAKAARPKGSGNTAKAIGGSLLASASGNNESTMLRAEPVDDAMHAVIEKFLKENKIAPLMVAKWYNYDAERTPKFNTDVIVERGINNASAAEQAQAAANAEFKAMLSGQGFELLNNTYVVVTNLRFRNNKALAKEISDMAAAATAAASQMAGAGGLGSLATLGAKKGTEAMVNALMKDMYSVTAVTNLYKLDWNDDIDQKLSDAVLYNPDATLEDLINQGVCNITYVGQTKARSGVKKNKEKTLGELAENATSRAIDKALAKLQVEYDQFRTTVPVSKSADGFIYAKIGTKEGVMEGDEYDILEQQIDPKTQKINYKKVGSAKVEKNGVWFNTTGAEELVAEANEKEAQAMKEAMDLGYTKFKGPKKDLSGYYLRLAKKKGKIKD